MGLDMYAYLLRKDLAPAKDTDVSPELEALRFLAGNEFLAKLQEVEDLPYDDPRRKSLSDEREAWLRKAREDGLINMDFAYWRKFNHLHGWMEQLYRKKSGQSECFNLCTVRLSEQDLKQLLEEAAGLTPTKGFFFGSYGPLEPEDVKEVVTFAANGLQAVADGFAVYYDSWW